MGRAMPPVSVNNFTDIFTKPIFQNQNGEWYRDVGYEDSLDIIRENFYGVRKNFVAIGYYLKHLKEKELFKKGGYQNIWEMAQEEFGLSQPAATFYMKMNDAYSVNGDTPLLDDKYADFNKSQLQEMLYLPEEKREEIKPEQTVSEIRQIAKEEKKQKEPSEKEIHWFYDQHVKDMDAEPRNTLKERLKDQYRNADGGDSSFNWKGSARGLSINSCDEITWTQLVKLINQCIPQQTDDVIEAGTSEPVEEQQLPGQMEFADYPGVMPEEDEPDLIIDNVLTTEGCGNKNYCFLCAQDCGIRQEGRYCIEAPMGNPFPCTTMNVLQNLKDDIGEACQFINHDLAYHTTGSNEARPCCKGCKVKDCGYRCQRLADADGLPVIKKKKVSQMDKEKVREMVCEAINNIPECAEIVDCYTEHSFGDSEAYIKIHVRVKEETEDSIMEFHNVAHDAFNTDMGFIS